MSLFVILNGLAGAYGWYWVAGVLAAVVLLVIAWKRWR